MSWFRKNKQKTPHPIELANTNNRSKTALSKYNSNDTANYPVNSLLEDEASPPSFYPEGCCEDLCELSYTNSKTCCCVNNSFRWVLKTVSRPCFDHFFRDDKKIVFNSKSSSKNPVFTSSNEIPNAFHFSAPSTSSS